MESAVTICCLLFSLIHVAVSSQNGVPAVIWSNEEGRTFPEALTGHSINVQQFQDGYLPSQHHMVLFLQDKLSMEDFTHHADVYNENTDGATFHNLKHIMETEASSHVPSLSSSASLLDSMKLAAEQVHTLESPYDVQALPLKTRDLIVVRLPTTVGLHTKKALKQIDGIMKNVHEQLKKRGATFTAVYTAEASSKPVGPMVSAYQGGRHLLQATAESSNASFWNVSEGCLYLYTQDLVFEVYTINKDTKLAENVKNYTLPPMDKFDPSSTCANGSATLVVKYDSLPKPPADSLELSKFEFTMKFSSDKTYWTMHSMTITYEGQVASTKISGTDESIEPAYLKDIWAPSTYSYHCYQQTPLRPNNTKPQEDLNVRIRTVQLQLQMNDGPYSGAFGQVNDCIGFFTLPIWSALISMAVLLMVFFFGVCMLSAIDTQDRFDDPKGKTIQVNVSD